MAYVNTNRAASIGLVDRIAALFSAAQRAVQRRRIYNRTVNELSNLSTRELNDLGISRSMITRLACEAAYGA